MRSAVERPCRPRSGATSPIALQLLSTMACSPSRPTSPIAAKAAPSSRPICLACGPHRLARRACVPKLLLQLGKVAVFVFPRRADSSSSWSPLSRRSLAAIRFRQFAAENRTREGRAVFAPEPPFAFRSLFAGRTDKLGLYTRNVLSGNDIGKAQTDDLLVPIA